MISSNKTTGQGAPNPSNEVNQVQSTLTSQQSNLQNTAQGSTAPVNGAGSQAGSTANQNGQNALTQGTSGVNGGLGQGCATGKLNYLHFFNTTDQLSRKN